jgi:hypothetical protein
MKKMCFFVLLVLMTLSGLSLAIAADLTADSVRTMVGDVEIPGDAFRSFALDMHMRLPSTPVHFFCRLRYQAPNSFSLHVFDGSDSTPVLVVCDEFALINDPFADKCTLIASSGVVFELQPQQGQYTANFAFNQPVDGQVKNRIGLDFKTMFSRLVDNTGMTVASSGALIFSAETKENSRCVAEVIASGAFSLGALKMFIENEEMPVLDFSMIRADIGFSMPVFPLHELHEDGLTDGPVVIGGVVDTMGIMSSVFKAVFARAAIKAPEIREKVSQMFNSGDADWQDLSSRDAERGARLRRIFNANSLDITP